ncbi:metal-dependent hydrolase [Sporosarcina sp. Marseille-Q4063]|uniref:metal-dependent hydrolase n=1 Tax=Sporosarcina sp. Marseille-Q4063 TaxID=2810514 RepID=UPI001BB00AFF|nr:metal-dependent hydrolase [Sporosarcina sp. Marseille-Q4063]QUW21991.1 metal-dependent hydrolase [Sporosarcina sp. Marseille-Q4063]
MTGKTHILGGIAASLAYTQFTNHDPLIMVGAGIVGALLPDICHRGSKIGRKLPILSKMINVLFGHRTFTHSLLFLVIITWLLNSFIPSEAVKAGVLAGMVSHYVLDMATKNGIKLFFPLSMTVRFPLTTRTGGKIESLVFSILSLLSFYFAYHTFSIYL